MLWKRTMCSCIAGKTEIYVITESGPGAVTVNAASLASFELTCSLASVNFPFSTPKICNMMVV